jgi:hypothetical protein
MKRFTNLFLPLTLVFALMVSVAVLTTGLGGGGEGGPPATWYPDQGEFYFNSYSGDDVVLLDLKWNNAGDFSTDYPVVEIDFGIYREDYHPDYPYDGCSATVDLPRENYSDCSTSGVSEDEGRAFGFGTFGANKIADDQWYYNDLYLKESFYYEQWSDGYPLLGWNVYATEFDGFGCSNPWCLVYSQEGTKILLPGSLEDLRIGGLERTESWNL